MELSAEEGEYLAFAHKLADAARAHTLPRFRAALDVTDKADKTDYSPVTIADRESEAAMRALIHETYPDHGIEGEELGAEASEGAGTWVLDPIDGTKSFIIGVPLWGTLIAFDRGDGPILGIVDQPVTGERFIGHAGGAFLGERRLATRRCAALADAVLCTTGPELFAAPEERRAFEQVSAQVRLTRYGTDCYGYCMLAHGLVDLVIEAGLAPWDIQALIPLIHGAGGVVTTWDGGPAHRGGRIVAAGDPALHAQVLPQLATAGGRTDARQV